MPLKVGEEVNSKCKKSSWKKPLLLIRSTNPSIRRKKMTRTSVALIAVRTYAYLRVTFNHSFLKVTLKDVFLRHMKHIQKIQFNRWNQSWKFGILTVVWSAGWAGTVHCHCKKDVTGKNNSKFGILIIALVHLVNIQVKTRTILWV